jgi:hypothetical protein
MHGTHNVAATAGSRVIQTPGQRLRLCVNSAPVERSEGIAVAFSSSFDRGLALPATEAVRLARSSQA